jgi:hypothetical protein
MVQGADRYREVAMAQSGVPIVCTLHPNEWGGRLLVDVEVPAEAAPTLDGLAGIAERAAAVAR